MRNRRWSYPGVSAAIAMVIGCSDAAPSDAVGGNDAKVTADASSDTTGPLDAVGSDASLDAKPGVDATDAGTDIGTPGPGTDTWSPDAATTLTGSGLISGASRAGSPKYVLVSVLGGPLEAPMSASSPKYTMTTGLQSRQESKP